MSQKHIFVVDDNTMFAEMLKDHLSKHPAYKVSVFQYRRRLSGEPLSES